MADEQTIETQGLAPPADGSQEQVFTKAQVEAMIKDRVDRLNEVRRKEVGGLKDELEKVKAAPPPSQKSADSSVGDPSIVEKLQKRLQDMEFEQLVGGFKPTEEQRNYLRRVFDPENPREVLEMAKAFGLGAEKPAATPESQPPQFQSGGAPAARQPGEVSDNPITWTKDDIARLQREGSFLRRVEEYANRLPGGSGGLFKKRIPAGVTNG